MSEMELFNYIIINYQCDPIELVQNLYPYIDINDFSFRYDNENIYLEKWNEENGPKPTISDLIAQTPIVYAQIKRTEINKIRNEIEMSGFEYLGKWFDSDTDSQRRISIAVLAAQVAILSGNEDSFSVIWTCADNSTINLNARHMIEIPIAMASYGTRIHYYANDLKNQIEDIKNSYINEEIDVLTALEQIKNIKWENSKI